nr:hypothetical protein [Tanacetum cinerariifolium]
MIPVTSAEDKAQRRLEVKAMSTLMMAMPNEHQLKFNSIKDAKSLLEAIEKRYMNQKSKGYLAQALILKNMAFVSSSSNNNTNSSNEAVNTAFEVTTDGTQVSAANSTNIDNLSDAIICAFLLSQSNSSQHVNEDLDQIHPDDLEEMDLKWQMVMLIMRARRFIKNTGRKLNLNGNEIVAFDKTKSTKRNVPVETTNSLALVSCNGLGGHDWSDQAKEGPNYALMAYSTSSSDSKKSELMVLGYKASLKSVEERLEFFKTNESIYSEDIKKLKIEIHCNEITIRELRKRLETVQREKYSIQLTIEKLENASKSLNKLIDSQIVDHCKKGLGYYAVLPPHTGLFMHPKPDLSYIVLEEFISEPAVKTLNAKTSEDIPKVVKKDNGALIIKDCKSDDEDKSVTQHKIEKKTVKPSVAK